MIPWNRFKGSDLTKKKNPLCILLFLLIICAVLLADSKYRLQCTEYSISAANLPEGFDGYKIVQLSDLHMAQFGENNCRLVETVAKLHPDLIALTGDYIEAEEDIPVTETLVRQLVEIARFISPAAIMTGPAVPLTSCVRPSPTAAQHT